MPAGTYTRTGFEPATTIGLDGTWRAVAAEVTVIWLERGQGEQVVSVQIVKPDWAYGQGARPVTNLDAALAVATVRAHGQLDEIESSASRIGGLEGLQITVENRSTDDAWFLHIPPGDLKVSAGRRSWMAFFDAPGGVVAILVGGPASGWDEALTIAEPVLEQVRFDLQ